VIEKLKEYKLSLITEAVTKGLNPDVPMKDSGVEWIGEIPVGWECVRAKYVIQKIGDIDHYMPESVESGVPYLMTGDLKGLTSEINFEICKKISISDYKKLSKKIKPDLGDIIFARYATIGTLCYVNIENEFIVSYSCVIIKTKMGILDGKFLLYYFKSSAFMEDIKQYINSNTQGNVGIDSLRRAKIVLPNMFIQQQIASYLDNKCNGIDSAIAKKQFVIDKLTEYKKSLIYELVTGKKEV
jgi:type I restriction enzyme S subunit